MNDRIASIASKISRGSSSSPASPSVIKHSSCSMDVQPTQKPQQKNNACHITEPNHQHVNGIINIEDIRLMDESLPTTSSVQNTSSSSSHCSTSSASDASVASSSSMTRTCTVCGSSSNSCSSSTATGNAQSATNPANNPVAAATGSLQQQPHACQNTTVPTSHSDPAGLPGLQSTAAAASTDTCTSTHGARMSPSRVCSGPKYKLMHEGDIQVCRLNHTRTIVSKIMSSKFLRRWEGHHLLLGDKEILSTIPNGFMEQSVPYASIEDIHVITRWDAGHKFCMRITIPDGSVLLQASNAYLRDQWLYSIQWKRQVLKYRKILQFGQRPEVLSKEIKSMIDFCLSTPLQDDVIQQVPMDLVSELIRQMNGNMTRCMQNMIITALAPMLERQNPSPEIAEFYSMYCLEHPRSSTVIDYFTQVVQRILKHNMDFGKFPKMRMFVQSYIEALNSQNDGMTVVQNFVKSMHGPSCSCPHPRVLPNLVAVCLAAIYMFYEERMQAPNRMNLLTSLDEEKIFSFAAILDTLSTYEDWRPHLSSLLQPIPFPDEALNDKQFLRFVKSIVNNIAMDICCEVHLSVLGIRDGKEGWFQLFCPGGICCDDDGLTYTIILKKLISCCCRRKKFLLTMNKMLGPCMLLALRENEAAIDALCSMLEMEVVDSGDMKLQMITTLQSTSYGKKQYAALCERQIQLRELQQKGGPRKLTLPSKSTDTDLAKLLSCGSFGNLECLSLAFTQVTSACAEQLIKLPSLKYLNLWSTQFGDTGLQLISEHLHKLQVLNLCETPVTDKGLTSLSSMKNLRKLNLNSTSLSARTFEGLKEKLPALQECDVRYTDAW